jgi:hypothetical protein
MNIELIPIIVFAWFVELSGFIETNFTLLFFTPLLAVLWALGIIAVMRRWDGR